VRSPLIVVSPAHHCNAHLAIAASRGGETGVLDLGYSPDRELQRSAVQELARQAHSSRWGVRWDTLGEPARTPAGLKELLPEGRCPLLVLVGVHAASRPDLEEMLKQARTVAGVVLLEVCSLEEAQIAAAMGFDGVIVKGHEAGGYVSDESTYLLLQRLHGRLTIPYWVQGGIGPDTAAAAFLAGAAGVVLAEQLWLTAESPMDAVERKQWAQLDGSETACLGENRLRFRFFSRTGPLAVHEMARSMASGAEWSTLLRERLTHPTPDKPLIALGQDIAFARRLADKYVTVAGILQAIRRRVPENLAIAHKAQPLGPEAPLAQAHGTLYPILQGPMTRVSDTAAFCLSVAENGALPFLALALMTGPEVRKLLTETKERLGQRSWGVGILGFVPAELRKVQLEAVTEVCPPFAIIAGGRPSQARGLEDHQISTYLHVPSPGLLEVFIRDGARKFIFEGRECGGHVGPRSSFCLWQSAVDVLLTMAGDHPQEFQVVFAGGIHDGLSAAMVAAAAAPLTAKGMKIGVLMGTGYLFTHEAVQTGAITAEFQRQAIACQETILLDSGVGHATRCVKTPFADEFNQVKKELLRAGKSSDEIRYELEWLNIGRLRIASKGLTRQSDPRDPSKKAELVEVDEEEQRRSGMYMIGQLAGLRDKPLSMAAFHAEVSKGSVAILERGPGSAECGAGPALRTPRSQVRAGADIAVVGIACMFPKAPNLRQYWQNICNRVDAIQEVPADRWRAEDFFNEDRLAPDQVYSKWGGFLDKVVFDPVKWRIPPASLQSIEPIQLLALEIASQAMADAGYDRRDYPRDKAGVVFAVAGSHDVGTSYAFRTMARHYLPKVEGLSPETRRQVLAGLEEQLPHWTEDSFPGFLMNVVAGRIARELDLNGPNYVVDAACAAALAALHTAIEQLRSGTADMMLVGAADATNNPFCFMSFAKTHALSPRGRSRPFDDSGDGIALGEGIACIIIKRLADAERDGDKIYAVIKGMGASSDGKNRSLTAPHPPGQIRAMERAYQDAQVSPATVSLIEAHGTGTVVGDSAELTTLTQVFAPHSQDKQYSAIGSVKSMIGHTKTVAGLASLIKTVLALKHRVLPPTIGVEKPTRRVDFAQSPFYLNTETRPWIPENGHPRRAGVSAFGFGGTNFHVVLEEYTGTFHPGFERDMTPRSAEVFLFQRASREELLHDLHHLDHQLAGVPTAGLTQLACSVWHEENARPNRSPKCRLGIVASSLEELRQKIQKALTLLVDGHALNDPSGMYYSEATAEEPSQVCFLYPGQGSQAINMLRDLVVACPWGHDLFARVNRQLAELLPQPLTRYIYPVPVFDEADRKRQVAAINDTKVAQPSLGVVELFATRLLERFGVRPGLAAGHSYGELVALHAAGCLSEEELMWLSAMRGRVCAEASEKNPGGMAAVRADAETTRTALKELDLPLTLANLNAPDQTIIAGPVELIEAAVTKLAQKTLNARRLPVTAAFHSPMLIPSLDTMTAIFGKASFRQPQRPVYSNTTGTRHADDPEVIRGFLARHFTEPVLFENQVRQLYADGARVFLEVGPGKVLSDLVGRILKDEAVVALPLEASGHEGWTQLGHVLARITAVGLPVQLGAWFAGRGLVAQPLAEFFEKTRAQSKPKPTDWILGATRAEPVTPLPAKKPVVEKAPVNGVSEPKKPALAPAVELPPAKPPIAPEGLPVHPPSGPAPVTAVVPTVSGVPNGPPKPAVSSPSPISQQMTVAMTTTNGERALNGNGAGHAYPGLEMFMQIQATTRMMLKVQQAQQRMVERFLETQERLLAYCVQGAAALPALVTAPPPAPVAAAPMETAPPVPPSRGAPTPSPVRPAVPMPPKETPPHRMVVAPPPVADRKPVAVATPRAVSAPASQPAAPRVQAAPPPAPAAALVDAPPPTEAFRRDLLQVVSERTGYPVDMLDETLPLEAGLGIDSIKTVEIFSKLKEYHVFFRQGVQDEEELLAEFTRLKTLKDIIDSYDRHRQAYNATPTTNGQNGAAHPGQAPDKKSPSVVERFAVTATEAPLEGNGSKKKIS
jgi:acyl transferase domain-containing protein/NAD(P)H-dependent flavin oxidoreductase YrpB (nitropropane dioxygenase family)